MRDVRAPVRKGRRFAVVGWLLLIGLGLAGCTRSPPNVLLVTIDTLRADRLGAYGHQAAHTPVLDQLAREGVLFENAIAVAPVTMPSHASIMTGLLPPAHGVRDNGTYVLDAAATTLAEVLADAGYDTAGFVSAVVLAQRYGIAQGFAHYDDELWSEADPKLFMIRERRAERTVERALHWLDQREARQDRRPFLAWVHLFDPHQPYHAPLVHSTRTTNPYDAEVAYVDHALGALFEHLKQTGQWERTLVVVTADHGESLGEHGERTHAVFIYRSTTHVPLLLRLPGRFEGGQRYVGPVRSIDILPTILASVGVAIPAQQGQDLQPLLAGPAPDLPQYSESLVSELGFGMAPLFGVRSRDHTWIRAPRAELYNLRADPAEQVNLQGEPLHAVLGDDLDALLDELLADSAARALQAQTHALSSETMEMLQSLGYLQGASDRAGVAGLDPKDGMAVYNQLERARHLAQREQWAESEQELRSILERIPAHTSARGVLALTLLQQDRLDEAEAEYRALLQADPGQFRLYGMLGVVALRRGDLDAAEQHYRAALAVSPQFVEAISQLGLIATLRGAVAEATEWLEQARALDPEFPPVYRRLGDLLYDREDFAGALAQYQQALERRPQDVRALVQAGNSARRLADPEAAARYFERARNADSEHWVASYNLACLHLLQGRPEAAFVALDEAIARGFRQPGVLENDPDWDGFRADLRYQQRLRSLRRALQSDHAPG